MKSKTAKWIEAIVSCCWVAIGLLVLFDVEGLIKYLLYMIIFSIIIFVSIKKLRSNDKNWFDYVSTGLIAVIWLLNFYEIIKLIS